jgi:hypothetical protein
MRPGWERDRPRFSDVKLHPEPFFVNRLRLYVLKAGLGVESVSSALHQPMGDASRKFLRSNTVDSIFLSSFASESSREEPIIGSVSAHL